MEGAIKNGQSRALSTLGTRDWRSNQEWTIQRHWQINVRENRRDDNQECTIQSTVNFRHTRLKEQLRMDNPEHCQLWAHDIEGAIKNGQSRALLTLDTRDWRSNQEWTIQSTVNLGHTRLKEQSRMDNLEHCQLLAHEIEGAIKNGQSRALLTLDTRDWRSNQEWTIQRHWQLNVRENRREDIQEWTIHSTVNFGHTRLKEQSRMDNPEHC